MPTKPKISKLATIKNFAKSIAGVRARHRERHTASGFGFAASDRLGALSRDAWESVTRDAGVWMSWRYLTVLEKTAPENIKLTFALVLRNGEPVAAVAAQITTITGERIGAKMLAKQKAKIIVCGNLFSWGPHGVAFKPGENETELWKGVAEALYRIRRAERLLGQADLQIIKDMPAASAENLKSIHRLSYRPVETDPDMVLDILPNWKKYDDYLASLNAKYRRAVRDIMKDTEAAGLRVERLRDVGPHAAELHHLYLQIHEQAAVRPVTLNVNYIPALAAAFGDGFRCTVLRNDDMIAGFITTFQNAETAVGYYIGVHKELNANIPIYHRLLHITISDAIEMGCKRLSLGRTALEAKARLGARPVPLFVWTRHRIGALNAVMAPLLRTVSHGEAPDRNPFK